MSTRSTIGFDNPYRFNASSSNASKAKVDLAEPGGKGVNFSCRPLQGLDEEPVVSCWFELHQLHLGQKVAVHLAVGSQFRQ
jgi:hypothetical protein